MEKLPLYEMKLVDDDDEGVFAISLVTEPAIKSFFVALAEQKKFLQFKTQSEDKKIVTGPLLIPNKPIFRNWTTVDAPEGLNIFFSEETVSKSHEIAMKRGLSTFTTEHQSVVPNIHLMETWIIDDPEMDKSKTLGFSLDKGSWMVSLKINNQEIWDDYIKTGELRGFSLEGLFSMAEQPVSAEMSDEELLKRIKAVLS